MTNIENKDKNIQPAQPSQLGHRNPIWGLVQAALSRIPEGVDIHQEKLGAEKRYAEEWNGEGFPPDPGPIEPIGEYLARTGKIVDVKAIDDKEKPKKGHN